MTSSILSLQEILTHCRALPTSWRAFYEAVLTHGDVVAVRVNYLPGSLLWLVTTPTQARLMREGHDPDAHVGATILSLQEARELLTTWVTQRQPQFMRRRRGSWLRRQKSSRALAKVRRRPPVMTRWPAVVAAMLALSGCATTWSRPATSEAEFNLDSRVCQHMNTQLVVPIGDHVVRSGYQRCMLEEGYTEGGSWQGNSGWQEE